MEKYFYSPSKNQFLAESMLDSYKESGSWPNDATIVNDYIYQEFGANPAPLGKIMSVGIDGLPVWIDQPGSTSEELVAQAEAKKEALLSVAATKIAPLQDALDLGLATEDEQRSLLEWKQYRIFLNRVDTSSAPKIEWPEVPL